MRLPERRAKPSRHRSLHLSLILRDPFDGGRTLSERPLLEQLATRLDAAADLPSLEVDPIVGLQSKLAVISVPGPHAVELAATGPNLDLPSGLLAV